MYTFFYVKVLEANPVSVSPCAPIRRAMHTNSTPQILISENILILFILDVLNGWICTLSAKVRTLYVGGSSTVRQLQTDQNISCTHNTKHVEEACGPTRCGHAPCVPHQCSPCATNCSLVSRK